MVWKLANIDPKLLHKQTQCVIRLQIATRTASDKELLEGVVNLLEALHGELDGETPTLTLNVKKE